MENYVEKITLKKIQGKKDTSKVYTVLRVYMFNGHFVQTFVNRYDIMNLFNLSPTQAVEFLNFDDEIEIK